MQARTKSSHGFTIVELMMSLAVLAVGISGIIAMQKITAASNMHSKSVATATYIANTWLDQLLTDGSVWRASNGINATTWLKSSSASWFRPSYDPDRLLGAGFDALGNPVTDDNIQLAQFCVHLLLVKFRVNSGAAGDESVRATLRVMWPRAQATFQSSRNFCDNANDVVAIGADTSNYHSIYQTVAIRVHP
jgi:type IV pilus assembly protein PilV